MSLREFDFRRAHKRTQQAPPPQEADGDAGASGVRVVENIEQEGYRAAGGSQGATRQLSITLGHIFHGTILDRASRATGEKYSEVGTALVETKARLRELEEENKEHAQTVKVAQATLDQMRRDHVQKGAVTHRPSEVVGFYLATGLLVVITLFLYVFYFNVSYNAFLYSPVHSHAGISSNSLLMTAIFNSRAFSDASRSGLTFYGILLCPFVFIGIGYLMHAMLEQKKWWAVVLILLFTLLGDSLLAHETVRKIHDAEYLLGEVPTPWSPNMALQSAQFYMILFFGFLVYVLWGLILHSVLGLWDKLRHDKHAMKEVILRQEAYLKGCSERLQVLKTDIQNRRAKIVELENNLAQFKHLVQGFMRGWVRYISGLYEDSPVLKAQKEKEAEDCKNETLREFLGGNI